MVKGYEPLQDRDSRDIKRLTFQEFKAACAINEEIRDRIKIQNDVYEDKVEFTSLHTMTRIQEGD